MELSTLIGLFLGIFAIGLGMILKGASLAALINPAAFLIIIVGTAASLFVSFPLAELKKFPVLLKIVFFGQKFPSKPEIISQFVDLAGIARREGLLALESQIEQIGDPFIRTGITLVVDGTDPEFVKAVMMEEIYAIEERHRAGALIFTQAGTYAPTLGVLGAVVGLIAALGNLKDIEKLGHSIAAAFVATLLGIFTGYVLWHPIANKLKRLSNREIEIKHLAMEGILCIQEGTSPVLIEQNLLARLPAKERQAYEAAKGKVKNEEG